MWYKLRILLFVLLPVSLVAQNDVSFSSKNFKGNKEGLKLALQKIKEGDKHIQAQQYGLALPCYLTADSINPDNADLNVKIGLCYLNSYYKARCLGYFEHAQHLNPTVSKRLPYFLGQGYHLNYQWDSAIAEFQLFLHKANSKEKKEVDKYIEECNNGKELMQHPVRAKMENLSPLVNSIYPDYSPFITADESEIVITSKRPNSINGNIDPISGEYYEDIYMAKFKNGQWDTAKDMGPPINNFRDNDATAYLTSDGQKLFIFRGDIGGGDIYESSYGADGWSTPVSLGKNINSRYHESSVCLSPDGKTLYFVSDRPGGKGGRDIYKSYLQEDSTWGPAINLGDTINTPYDEEGVFIHPDGKTLYFSSKGHNTMGGYDIFRSVYDSGRWSVPENLGYPINTPDDDVFFIVSASGKHGYYASAKYGEGGGLDIYRVDMESLKPKLIVLKGIVGDSITRAPLMASIKLINKTSNVTSPFSSNASTGNYLLSLPSGSDYEVDVHADGYPDYSFTMSIPDTTTYKEMVKNIYLLKPGSAPVVKKDTVKPVVVPQPVPTVDSCKPDKATVVMRFAGFTKDTAALLRMVNKLDSGICLKDLRFTVQIGAYHFPKNFRYKAVEIKPIAIKDFPDGITRFTMGSYYNYNEAIDLRNEAIKRGIKDAFITGIYNGKRILLAELLRAEQH